MDQITETTPVIPVKYGKGRPKKGEIRPLKPPKGSVGRPRKYADEALYKADKAEQNRAYYQRIREIVKNSQKN